MSLGQASGGEEHGQTGGRCGEGAGVVPAQDQLGPLRASVGHGFERQAGRDFPNTGWAGWGRSQPSPGQSVGDKQPSPMLAWGVARTHPCKAVCCPVGTSSPGSSVEQENRWTDGTRHKLPSSSPSLPHSMAWWYNTVTLTCAHTHTHTAHSHTPKADEGTHGLPFPPLL